MEQNLKWLISGCCLAVMWLIFIPFSIYCITTLYRYREDIIIQTRYPKLTVLFGIFALISFVVTKPLYLLLYTLCDDPTPSSMDCSVVDQSTFNIIYYCYLFLFYTLWTHTFWIILLRFWLIFFEANWIRSTMNKDWKIHLNPMAVQKNWYLSHKSSFGSTRYCASRMAVAYIFIFGTIAALRIFVF